MKTIIYSSVLLVSLSAVGAPGGNLAPAVPTLTLQQVMKAAASYSPEVQAAHLRDVAAENHVGVEQSHYYPTVEVQAAEGSGFAGSQGHLGIAGPIASPFRAGAAVGVVSNFNIWDFGRTANAVSAAEHNQKSEREQTSYQRYRVYQTALELYYQCELFRTQALTWKGLTDDAQLVRNEVMRFVRTGQRSVVERYLADSQLQEFATQVSVAESQLESARHELSVLTGLREDQLACPELPDERAAVAEFRGPQQGNPIIRVAEEKAAAARSEVQRAKSDYLPKIVGIADAAWMQDQRLVAANWYSVAVGVIIPVFEGFKTDHMVKEARALEASREREVAARRQQIEQLNAKYDRLINAKKVALTHLRDENTLAQEGFDTAKRRYFSLQGSVIDVR